MRRKIYHIFNINMSVPLKMEEKLSWKIEILKVSYFQHEITCYKLPQHPRRLFPWRLDVCKS